MIGATALKLDGSSFDRLQPIDYPPQHYPKSLHVVRSNEPSLLPQKYVAEGDAMRPGTIQRTTRNQSDVVPSKVDVKRAIKSAIYDHLPAYKITAAEIADKIGANDATVEGWRSRDGGVPSAEYVLMLMVAFPDFGAAVCERVGLRPTLSPEIRRVVADMERVLSGRAA